MDACVMYNVTRLQYFSQFRGTYEWAVRQNHAYVLGLLTLYSSLKSFPSSAERSLYSSSRWSTGMGR